MVNINEGLRRLGGAGWRGGGGGGRLGVGGKGGSSVTAGVANDGREVIALKFHPLLRLRQAVQICHAHISGILI